MNSTPARRCVVIVTGGGRGIGAATARLLGRQGADVVVNYRAAQAEADAVVADIAAAGGRAIAVAGDVAEEADVLRLFRACDDAFGPLTGLVNNAGLGGLKHRVEETDFAYTLRLMRVNLGGVILCTREAVRRMSIRTGGSGGAIVNVSSIGAVTGSPNAFTDYAATKGAVDSFTIGVAGETAGYGIRVNAVRPGMIDTDIHASSGMPDRVARHGAKMPIGRAGTAAEVAEIIVFLLSSRASYITGTIMNVAGGVR